MWAFEYIETCPFEFDINARYKTDPVAFGAGENVARLIRLADSKPRYASGPHTTNDFCGAEFRPSKRCNASSVVSVKSNTASGKRDNALLCRVGLLNAAEPVLYRFRNKNLSFRERSVTHRCPGKGHVFIIYFILLFFLFNLSAEKIRGDGFY